MNATEKQTAYAASILEKIENADGGRLAELPAKIIIEMKGLIASLQPGLRIYDDAEELENITAKLLIGGRLMAAALESGRDGLDADRARRWANANAGKIASSLRRGKPELAEKFLAETNELLGTDLTLAEVSR